MLKNSLLSEEVAWNMDSDHLMQISNLLNQADSHYLDCNFQKCALTLKGVKLQIIQNLNPEERVKLKRKEEQIHLHISIQNIANREFSKELSRSLLEKINKIKTYCFPKIIEDYREMLMDLLAKYGFLSNKKRNRTRLNM